MHCANRRLRSRPPTAGCASWPASGSRFSWKSAPWRREAEPSAHGNSLRALVKYLDGISDDDIVGLNIPTARPLVYELDQDLQPIRNYYLGDPDEIARAMAAVAAQGKARPAP